MFEHKTTSDFVADNVDVGGKGVNGGNSGDGNRNDDPNYDSDSNSDDHNECGHVADGNMITAVWAIASDTKPI